MNTIRKLFYFFTIASVLLLNQAPLVMAITLDELADICEAMESAILDISVEYKWGVEPPPTLEDIAGTGLGIDKGPVKHKWSTKRPFGERSLSAEQSAVLDEHGELSKGTSMQSYNGKIAKYVMIAEVSLAGEQRTFSHGTITKSKRSMPKPNQTPISFSVLRLSHVSRDKTPLSERLRKKELVRFYNTVEKINGFNAVHADLLMDVDNPPAMRKFVYMRVYFSVDHGYTPIKYDYMANRETGPEPFSMVDVNSLEEVSKGLWFPSAGALKSAGSNLTNIYRATNIVVNQGLTDEHFNMEFPPGTKVRDEIAGVTYVIQPSEQLFNDWLENESAIAQVVKRNEKKAVTLTKRTATAPPYAEKQQITPTENKQMQPPLALKNSKNNITIYILAGIVCAILVILFFVGKSILNRGAQR